MTATTKAPPVPNRCRSCGAEGIGLVLHHDPDTTSPTRTLCGTCQGIRSRRILDNLNPPQRREGGGQ